MDKRAPEDDPGRSMLTPNSGPRDPWARLGSDPTSGWSEDFQSMVFHGYTANEVSRGGL